MRKVTLQDKCFLLFINSCGSEQRKAVLQVTNEHQLKLLVEIIFNLLKGIIPLPKHSKRQLSVNRPKIRRVIEESLQQRVRKIRLLKISNILPLIIQSYLKYESRIRSDNKAEI